MHTASKMRKRKGTEKTKPHKGEYKNEKYKQYKRK